MSRRKIEQLYLAGNAALAENSSVVRSRNWRILAFMVSMTYPAVLLRC
jgi:hypothetical protein